MKQKYTFLVTAAALFLALAYAPFMGTAFGQESNSPPPCGGNAQGEHEPPSKEHHEDTQDAQRKTNSTPLAIQIQQAPSQDSVTAETKQEGQWYTRPDWWVAGFTGALFFATVGLWVFTALMWRATKRAVDEGKTAIAAAQRSAQAAEVMAEAAIGIELPRPYVHTITLNDNAPGEILESTLKDILKIPRVRVVIKNWGRTPTFLEQESADIGISPLAPTSPGYRSSSSLDSGTVIEGRSVRSLRDARYTEIISAEGVQNLLNGATRLWVYGYVQYRDFLGDQHCMEFIHKLHIVKHDDITYIKFIEERPPKYI
jgi:hypothetical protein